MSLALILSILEEDLGEEEVGSLTAHSNMVWAAQCMDTVYNCESHLLLSPPMATAFILVVFKYHVTLISKEATRSYS